MNEEIELIEEVELFKKKLDLTIVEKTMLSMPQVEIPLMHEFIAGMYVRTILIPKGTLILGKKHRHKTFNILLAGEMSTFLGNDLPIERKVGPYFFESREGTQKLGYAHTDSIFVNIIPTDKTDIAEIEKEIFIMDGEYRQGDIGLISEGEGKCLE